MNDAQSSQTGHDAAGVTRRTALQRLGTAGILAIPGGVAPTVAAASTRQEEPPGAALTALATAVVAAINAGDAEALDAWVAEDFVGHAPVPLPGAGKGLAGVKENLAALRTAFPDGELTIEDMVAEDDTVVVRGVFRGTHEGEFLGIPPTGVTLEIPGVCVARVVDGKAVEYWSHFNQLAALEQAGLFSLQNVTTDDT